MRNISALAAGLTLLATQVNIPQGNLEYLTATAESSTSAVGIYEVKLNTNTASPIEIVGQKQPDYDAEVLQPLRAAQAAKQSKRKRRRVVVPAINVVLPAGSHSDWMRAAGIAERDFGYVEYIIKRESGWGVTKYNYGGSGAYGLGQALPATKMAAFGADYMTNPITQLKWANTYATSRYGSWAGAYAHFLARHSW